MSGDEGILASPFGIITNGVSTVKLRFMGAFTGPVLKLQGESPRDSKPPDWFMISLHISPFLSHECHFPRATHRTDGCESGKMVVLPPKSGDEQTEDKDPKDGSCISGTS